MINQNLKKYSNIGNIKFNFYPKTDNDINKLLEKINNFGDIQFNKYEFRICSFNAKTIRKYEINDDTKNIVSKNEGDTYYSAVLCKDELNKNTINKWKIKILETKNYFIRIGMASNDFDINDPINQKNKGWYYNCGDACLYTGPTNYYKGLKTNLNKKYNEIIVIMDMNEGTLKFVIDNEDKGNSFTDIPTDIPLYPAVFLSNVGDSVEITDI